MQTMPEEWPSMTRMLSCRHSKRVSCETLSVSNTDSDNIHESCYYSEDEKENMKQESTSRYDGGNELENPGYGCRNLVNDYLQQARELEKRCGKLDNPSYGDGKVAGHNFFSRFLCKVSHMSAASHAKEVERLRKLLRTNPSAIRHMGGVLPHSGPILLPIGSHSGRSNSKSSAVPRASSIFPRNAVAGKMTSSPSGAGEPFSPKVTCLGRVRNKQKHVGKRVSVSPNGLREEPLDVCCASMLIRRGKKKAGTEIVVSAAMKEKKLSRIGSGNAMVAAHHVERSKKTSCGKELQKITAQNSGGKGIISSRFIAKEESKSCRESAKHEESKISNQHQQSCQATEAAPPGASSPECPVDLSRFGSESHRGHEMSVASAVTSLVGNDSQRFAQAGKTPPKNALLLTRNRKANDSPDAVSASPSVQTALDDNWRNESSNTQFYTCSSMLKSDQCLPTASEVDIMKPVTIRDIFGRTSSLTTEGTSTACKSEKFQVLQRQHSGVDRQASLPKPSPELSIWQRRAIGKPCALAIKRRSKAEVNQHTVICK